MIEEKRVRLGEASIVVTELTSTGASIAKKVSELFSDLSK